MQIDTFTGADGVSLARYHWPVASPTRIFVISHGMAEHAARYDECARFLNQQGFDVWALDHRGHGKSMATGKQGHFGDRDGFRLAVNELLQLVDYARNQQPNLPVTLFGHSMGSFIARSALLTRPALLDSLILSATGFRQSPLAKVLGRVAAWLGRDGRADKPSALMSKLVFGTFNLRFMPSRTRFDWLSRDTAMVDAYMADPLCGFDCTPKLWQDLFAAIVTMELGEAGASTVTNTVSIRLIAGTHDPVSMGGLACNQLADRYNKLGLRDVSVKLYPQGRHELINETNRAEVWADMVSWLSRGVPRP